MGNGVGKLTPCFSCFTTTVVPPRRRHHHHKAVDVPLPFCYDDGLGHSFCYIRPDPSRLSSYKVHHHEDTASAATTSTTTFRSISGASVSANTSTTPLSSSNSILLYDISSSAPPAAAAFYCSTSFSSIPLQPVPRLLSSSGSSGSSGRGFLSGPIERGFTSGPLDPRGGIFSAPLDITPSSTAADRHHFSPGRKAAFQQRSGKVLLGIRNAISGKFSRGQNSAVAPTKVELRPLDIGGGAARFDGGGIDNQSLQWAQGKAGEDRVHVVISEEHGWVFVGIYDGFNGPDAPDYLLANLYSAVHRQLKGLLWDDKQGSYPTPVLECCGGEAAGDDRRRWKGEWDRDQLVRSNAATAATAAIEHSEVLDALSEALKKTEESFLEAEDLTVSENPELALMGSCVLVMLMKGEDVYLMNVGDSRAVLAEAEEPDSAATADSRRNSDSEGSLLSEDKMAGFLSLGALQLTKDHSTSVEEEVWRICKEHPDDDSAVSNDRVKGSLKVTRAFGAGFLKQPKWNNALLEMFRIDYVGTSPYISCTPSLCHHRLGARDRFLILSSDGLYQYFTNEEAVAEVELFIALYPEADPAQHLVEEVLFRAANTAGMDFHELLEIPHGDRRRYHDDVSVIIISLEGRIWRSSV